MGSTPSHKLSKDQLCYTTAEQLYNVQQNTFSNILLLDIRGTQQYQQSHIDLSHCLTFVVQLDPSSYSASVIHKEWLQDIIRLHQSSYSQSTITFYIIHNGEDGRVQNVCEWLLRLRHAKTDSVQQIETAKFHHITFSEYHRRYPFMCSDHTLYQNGRLYPSQITDDIFLSNWGIASDGVLYSVLHDIRCVINCTPDHANIFDADEQHIYDAKFVDEIKQYEEKENKSDAMFQKQTDKIKQLRTEFPNIRLQYFRVPIVDNADNDAFAYFSKCCAFIQSALDQKHKVLVHCRHGQSRSVTIVAAWLMHTYGCTADYALQYIKAKRPRSNPNKGFVQQLQKWGSLSHAAQEKKQLPL